MDTNQGIGARRTGDDESTAAVELGTGAAMGEMGASCDSPHLKCNPKSGRSRKIQTTNRDQLKLLKHILKIWKNSAMTKAWGEGEIIHMK